MIASRVVIASLGVVTAAALSVQAFRLGASDHAAAEALETISAAAWSRASPPARQWRAVRESLMEGLALAPSNPNVLESLGLLHLGRSRDAGMSMQARDHFLRAAALRPTMPQTWANLAEAKYRLGETDAAFEAALVNAVELGPWEPEVQRIVVDLGLAVWDEVKPRTRAAIERALALRSRREPADVLQTADRRGRLGVACRQMAGAPRTDPKLLAYCDQGRKR